VNPPQFQNPTSTEDQELQRILAMSRQDHGSMEIEGEDEEIQKAILESMKHNQHHY